jgi:sugar fermentation stimulation protein A
MRRGYYLSVGSAARNLSQRLARHLRKRKRCRWHIDYLRECAASCVALPIRASDALEHDLAASLGGIADWSVPRFGSSDCSCGTHLFGMADNPLHAARFIDLLLYYRMDRLAPGSAVTATVTAPPTIDRTTA